MRRAIAIGMALWGVAGLPARAHVVEHAFKDVPPSHWAADAVVQMALERPLMAGFADDTFRGELPLTRAHFARSLMVLLDELEALSRTSWREGAPGTSRLADVPADLPERRQILTLVNDYRLWEGVPALSKEMFRPAQTVTRSEVASVVRNLLAHGEARGVVIPKDVREGGKLPNRFKDIRPSEWAFQAILGVDLRYRVMIGFPDESFRPEDRLSRYQYAAVGNATFQVIRELVRDAVARNELVAERARRDRFQERRPLWLSLAPGYAFGSPGGINLTGGARYVAYPDEVLGLRDWFGIADLRAGLGPTFASSLMGGAAPQLPGLSLPGLGELQLQPYLGLRAQVEGGGLAVAPVFGGVAHWRTGPWGVYGLLDAGPAISLSGAPPSLGAGITVGADYLLSPKLAVGGGFGLTQLSTRPVAAPTIGVNLGF